MGIRSREQRSVAKACEVDRVKLCHPLGTEEGVSRESAKQTCQQAKQQQQQVREPDKDHSQQYLRQSRCTRGGRRGGRKSIQGKLPLTVSLATMAHILEKDQGQERS